MKCPNCGYIDEDLVKLPKAEKELRKAIETVISLGAQGKYKELKKFNKKHFQTL